MSLRFSLMGPVRAWRDDREVPLGPRQQRAVLAALLLNNGTWLPNEQLVSMVWDDPTPSAVTALRTYVYKLRRTFPELDLRSVDGGYSLHAELVLGEDEPLEGLRGRYFDAQRARLREQQVRAREDRLRRSLDVHELRRFVADHPLRERPRGLLMYALFRDGRQAEALEEFHVARRVLRDELGVEPGPELREMHQAILLGNPRLLGKPEQLPPDLADFTGRAREIDEIVAALPGVVGLAGLHGSGKTALAVHVAHRIKERYPDGQIFVRGDDVAGQLLRAIGADGGDAATWREKARHKRLLVIIDDVTSGVQDFVTPGSAYLLTSVPRLNALPGVHWVKVGGFTPDESLRFLRTGLGARVDAEIANAQELADALSHMPSALRVLRGKIAARPMWTFEMVLQQMARERALGGAIPSDCAAVLSPLVRARAALTPVEELAIIGIAQRDADRVTVAEAAEVLDAEPGAAELVLEALADVHLIEPVVLGVYAVPRFVRLYFGVRATALAC
ncbi:hypothetical protein Lesp02_08640 [Lentzea sp. NBRC 105346]|uniref:AfsR/SARP family transcriptional regulator n=1 Tax=Lentzea sp. NBRC 105346 TaxID=3032205 RepID=UPI0024A5F01C|nr:AfsR/SARP family transcriptional regulator [Lentzea sp. NBRC 105346]GLZ28674.1 hypothetical protein Lesp02_08640 [Lentzea sp. NBRC 105346]